MKTFYVTMVKDHHFDTEAHLFSTAEKAIAYAKDIINANSERAKYVDPDEASMSGEQLSEAGWLFFGCYSTEGDCVWVLPCEVDSDVV